MLHHESPSKHISLHHHRYYIVFWGGRSQCWKHVWSTWTATDEGNQDAGWRTLTSSGHTMCEKQCWTYFSSISSTTLKNVCHTFETSDNASLDCLMELQHTATANSLSTTIPKPLVTRHIFLKQRILLCKSPHMPPSYLWLSYANGMLEGGESFVHQAGSPKTGIAHVIWASFPAEKNSGGK